MTESLVLLISARRAGAAAEVGVPPLIAPPTAASPVTSPPAARVLANKGRAGRNVLWIVIGAVLVLVTGAITLVGSPPPDSASSRALHVAVGRALDDNSPMSRGRLVRATLTDNADATVEFVVSDGSGDLVANRQGALADIVAIARAAYALPEARLVDVTVIGLASAPSALTPYTPVLYASVPAERFMGRDWTRVASTDVPALVGVRWLPSGQCRAWHDCGATSP
jgi:hypothetical protein